MKEKPKAAPSGSSDDLAKGVAGLIDAAIGVGIAVARASAEVTARGAEVSPPQRGAAPFSVMIHYGLATAGNLLSLVSSTAAMAAAAQEAKPAAGNRPGSVPRVRPGARLRVPLSVENPGDRAMSDLLPLLRRLLFDGRDAPGILPAEAVQFTPKSLNVAPKDFEKLTVLVAVPEAAAAGRYDLILALGPDEPDLPLSFDVVPANPN